MVQVSPNLPCEQRLLRSFKIRRDRSDSASRVVLTGQKKFGLTIPAHPGYLKLRLVFSSPAEFGPKYDSGSIKTNICSKRQVGIATSSKHNLRSKKALDLGQTSNFS